MAEPRSRGKPLRRASWRAAFRAGRTDSGPITRRRVLPLGVHQGDPRGEVSPEQLPAGRQSSSSPRNGTIFSVKPLHCHGAFGLHMDVSSRASSEIFFQDTVECFLKRFVASLHVLAQSEVDEALVVPVFCCLDACMEPF